jgi:hypothetical protein
VLPDSTKKTQNSKTFSERKKKENQAKIKYGNV